MHYFVWERHHEVNSVPEDKFLDHKNQNKRDNRLENLEVVNGRVKQANAPKHVDNTSGYKGVTATYRGKFVARARCNRKETNGGTYATAIEAAYAVNLLYGKLHPEIEAPPNAPPEDALTNDQKAAVEANVERLLRPDRKPNAP